MAKMVFSHKDEYSQELLWKQFTQGDMSSFRKIYETNYRDLYDYGLRYLTGDQVEDCIQNLFLYILQHQKSIRKIKNVKAYLFVSFRNRIHKQNESKRIFFEPISSFVSADDSSYYKESLFSELRKLIRKLSPRESEIIHLKYYQGFKNMEIAHSLGIEYQTVRNTLAKAIKKLKNFPLSQ